MTEQQLYTASQEGELEISIESDYLNETATEGTGAMVHKCLNSMPSLASRGDSDWKLMHTPLQKKRLSDLSRQLQSLVDDQSVLRWRRGPKGGVLPPRRHTIGDNATVSLALHNKQETTPFLCLSVLDSSRSTHKSSWEQETQRKTGDLPSTQE